MSETIAVTYTGHSEIELWDRRKVAPGQTVNVTSGQAEALIARDPELWELSSAAAAPSTEV